MSEKISLDSSGVIKLPRPYDTAVRRDIRNISFYLNCAGVGFPG